MDYEKKYNEALERAREIKEKIMYSHLSTESCKAVSEYIDTIIPELAESEDERIRKYLIEELKVAKSVGELLYTIPQPTREECIAYLEKQKEQKPEERFEEAREKYQVEWSEEDEKMREHIISDLREFRDCETDLELVSDYEDEISWLKSLRPSWKPSEEQMDSLRDTIVQTKGYSYSMYLPELYEQLKKLM